MIRDDLLSCQSLSVQKLKSAHSSIKKVCCKYSYLFLSKYHVCNLYLSAIWWWICVALLLSSMVSNDKHPLKVCYFRILFFVCGICGNSHSFFVVKGNVVCNVLLLLLLLLLLLRSYFCYLRRCYCWDR